MNVSSLLNLLFLRSTDITVEHCRIEPTFYAGDVANAELLSISVDDGLSNAGFGTDWMHTGIDEIVQHHSELVQMAETMHQPVEMEDYGHYDHHDHYDHYDHYDHHDHFESHGGMCHDW